MDDEKKTFGRDDQERLSVPFTKNLVSFKEEGRSVRVR